MYIWWFLNFCVIFLWKACHDVKTVHLISPQSLASFINKNSNIFTKWSVANTVNSGTNTIIGALVYLRIFDSIPNNSTTFLGLCSPCEYRLLIVSNGRPHLQLFINGA